MEKNNCTEGAPEAKRRKCRIISDHFYDPDFQKEIFSSWNTDNPIKNERLEIITKPFKVCKISNFLNDTDFLDQIKADLLDVKSTRQDIDLFKMEQTSDLSKEKNENIKKLYSAFQNDVADWIEKNTAIHLNKKITMTGSCYSDTDYLICHDDRLTDRRVAFILYLSKDWSAEFGGTLDLFDTDEQGLPKNIVHSIVPEYNSLVFFEVTNNSYHQVSEILKPKARCSINGWFHGSVADRAEFKRPEEIVPFIDPEMTECDLSSWVSKMYLDPQTVCDIQEEVENDSSALLKDFISDIMYKKLSEEIQGNSIKWKMVGPPDVRRYEVADEDSLPETLASFIQLIKSVTFCQYLKNLTELDLVPETDEMKPKLNFELQRWSHGCYTLLKDEKSEEKNDSLEDSNNVIEIESNENISSDEDGEIINADNIDQYLSNSDHEEPGTSGEYEGESEKGVLEVILQFHTENFKSQSIAYVDKTEEDGIIMEIPYKDNHLSLVYITGTSQRLQKYMNHTVEGYTYCLICSYIE
ncbi:hypothetical protein TKK_0019544 [Trichogramma kaykai]|uniref:uS12 prolyl 3-hydroxylase n=1 Tax=Trichogramma kaykai TaxID=54128 RepID=A0ABD2VS21_9HYME